ncbi:unnamed protein product, partial [Amoebophrya sp. A120]|eukprot:GSA120T00013832001.1
MYNGPLECWGACGGKGWCANKCKITAGPNKADYKGACCSWLKNSAAWHGSDPLECRILSALQGRDEKSFISNAYWNSPYDYHACVAVPKWVETYESCLGSGKCTGAGLCDHCPDDGGLTGACCKKGNDYDSDHYCSHVKTGGSTQVQYPVADGKLKNDDYAKEFRAFECVLVSTTTTTTTTLCQCSNGDVKSTPCGKHLAQHCKTCDDEGTKFKLETNYPSDGESSCLPICGSVANQDCSTAPLGGNAAFASISLIPSPALQLCSNVPNEFANGYPKVACQKSCCRQGCLRQAPAEASERLGFTAASGSFTSWNEIFAEQLQT